MLENSFQRKLIKDLKSLFPGCLIYKNEGVQGLPDLTVLYGDRWALLECKRSEQDRNDPQPNQEYYVDYANQMSFSRFIYPENKQEVLHELQQAFRTARQTCPAEPK